MLEYEEVAALERFFAVETGDMVPQAPRGEEDMSQIVSLDSLAWPWDEPPVPAP